MRIITKLTIAQWKKVMKRALRKGGTGAETNPMRYMEQNPGLMESVFRREPPVTSEVGRVRTPPDKAKALEEMALGNPAPRGKVRQFPLAEAQERYITNPRMNRPVEGSGEVNRLRKVEPGGAPESEIAPGLAYEKQIRKPIISKEVDNTAMGKASEIPIEAAPAPIQREIRLAIEAELVWKNVIGSGNSGAGRVWAGFYRHSRYRRGYSNPKEYFIRSYIKWKDNPTLFAKRHELEARFMKSWSADIEQELLKQEQGVIRPGQRQELKVDNTPENRLKALGIVPEGGETGGSTPTNTP